MAFLDELRSYLEHVRAHPGEAALRISKEQYMAWVMEALDELEQRGVGAEELEKKYREMEEYYLTLAWKQLDGDLPKYLGAMLSPEEKGVYLKGATWLLAGLEPKELKRSRRIAVQYAIRRVSHLAGTRWKAAWKDPQQYARETLLIQNGAPTAAGHVYLHLVGMDSIAWLLALEAELSTGLDDELRICGEQLRTLGEGDSSGLFTSPPQDESDEVPIYLWRLSAMGIANQNWEEEPQVQLDYITFTFTPESIELFKQLGEGTHPFQPLVQSILQDMRDQTFESTLGVAPPHERAAESTMRLARDMAHEVRNKLMPIQSQLKRLYRAAESRGVPVAAHQEVIDVSIHQLHQYVTALLNVSKLLPKQSSKFDPSAALRDVVSDIRSEYPIHIEAVIPDPLPLLLGQRDRFVLAFRNLVRNAAQAVKKENGTHGGVTDKKVLVTVRHVEDLGELEITVEDSGPGIPSAYREQIFDAGFSMRDGGSGHGLAIVHQVVKGEFRGSIICDESPGLKGARFMAVLPLPERNTL